MAIKICLDAGHYKEYNHSPAIREYAESTMNWKLHLLLKKYLEEYGFIVTTTRKDKNKDLSLNSRGRASKGCDLFISIHSNAAGSEMKESVDYPIVYVPINGSADEIGKLLAECVAETMQTKQAGRCQSRKGSGNWDYYGVIYGAVEVGTPGIIIEHSFHTNTRSTYWLLDDNNLDLMARNEAKVLADYYGLEKKDDTAAEPEAPVAPVTPVAPAGLQATEFKNMENADVIEKVGPLCTADQKKSGVLASVTLAQFILESGYGKSELAQNANNCFGMKARLSANTWSGSTWDGSSTYTKETQEWYTDHYETVVDTFRKYPKVEDSIGDHSAYLLGAMKGDKKRYEGLKNCLDYKKAIQIIKDGGYATDPEYVSKICNIIEKWNLTKFDLDIVVVDYYRVRKSWEDSSTQIGAFTDLENAKKLVDLTPGYFVFDNSGKKIYPMPTTVNVTLPVLKFNDDGEVTKAAQSLLSGRGYDLGLSGVDGMFGNMTALAVQKFQTDNKLEVTKEVDPETWKKLLGV